MYTNLYQYELNQYKDSEDGDVKLLEELTKGELEAALERERSGCTQNKDAFEQAKSERRWQEAHDLKQQVDVAEGLVEKIKLQLVRLECAKKDTRFEYMNGGKMDAIRGELEKEILEATENYKNELEHFVLKQDDELVEYREEAKKLCEQESYRSPEAYNVENFYNKSLLMNDMLACQKMEKRIKQVDDEDAQTLARRNRKKYQDLMNGKELEQRKQLMRFKTRQEQTLIEIQKKWQGTLEVERKKTLHDNIHICKENDRAIADAKIEAVNKRPDKSVTKSIFGPKTKSNSDTIVKKFDVSINSSKKKC